MSSSSLAALGWAVIGGVVVVVLFTLLVVLVHKSARAWFSYVLLVVVVPLAAVGIAFWAGMAERSVFAALAAVLVAGGTAAHVLTAVKREGGRKLFVPDTEDAIEAGGWALMLTGAIVAVIAVFHP